MRFEQLECLLQIAETGSFTEAAKKLYLTQQAVSMSIKQLEQELDRTLIIRENGKVLFTKHGEEVVAAARNILYEKERILTSVQQISDADTLRVSGDYFNLLCSQFGFASYCCTATGEGTDNAL